MACHCHRPDSDFGPIYLQECLGVTRAAVETDLREVTEGWRVVALEIRGGMISFALGVLCASTPLPDHVIVWSL